MLKEAARRAAKLAARWLEEGAGRPPVTTGAASGVMSYEALNQEWFPLLMREGRGELRPQYTWGVLQGAHLGKALRYDSVSVIEFGVAGGNGLVSLERTAEIVERALGVRIDVFGFDTGEGLPKPLDHRDLPNLYSPGRHPMDVARLRRQLERAQLILGCVQDTVEGFLADQPAPIAFMAVDLDLYSSSVGALRVLDAHERLLLPRIHCYLDDIMGLSCSEFNGERLAVSEFNASHQRRKVGIIPGLKYFLPKPYSEQMWCEQSFMAHVFDHSRYADADGLAPLCNLDLRDV